MIISTVIFTQNDIGREPNEFTQEQIVDRLTIRNLDILMYVDLALYKISDNDYVVIKCLDSDLVNWRVSKELAIKLLKQFTGRLV